MSYLIKPRVFGMTNAQRTGESWDGGPGVIPAGVYVYTTDTTPIAFYVGDGSTVGGILIGPAPGGSDANKRVIFNDGGEWGSDARLSYDNSANTLSVEQVDVGKRLGLNGIATETIPSGNVSGSGSIGTAWNPTSVASTTILRVNPSSGSTNLFSIVAPAGGIIDGRVLFLINVGANDLILVNNSTAETTAANRFEFASSITIKPNEAIFLYYDGTVSRWKSLAQTRTGAHYHSSAADGGMIRQGFALPDRLNFTSAGQSETLGYTMSDITVTRVTSAITGSGNLTFQIYHSADRDATSAPDRKAVFTSPINITSTTVQHNTSGYDDRTIPAESWVWVEITAHSANTPLHLFVEYSTDYA